MTALMGVDLEIARGLEQYARDRFSPAPQATARMRARVMREARLAFAAQTAAPPSKEVQARPLARPRGTVRRVAGGLLAAALTLGIAAGVMAGSQPGGPLYVARVWLEAAVLPSEPATWAQAELVRLESRLNEVVAAAARGDEPAVAAALLAYEQIADELTAVAPGDPQTLELIDLALTRHLAVLQSVAARVPDQARAAIQRRIDVAIARAGARIDKNKPAETKPGTGPVTEPATEPKPVRSAEPAATPTATPDVTLEAAPPDATPTDATPTDATPAATPKPQPTPRANGTDPPATDRPKGPASDDSDGRDRAADPARGPSKP